MKRIATTARWQSLLRPRPDASGEQRPRKFREVLSGLKEVPDRVDFRNGDVPSQISRDGEEIDYS